MKSAATLLVRAGVYPASVAVALAVAVQLTPARVEASSLARPAIEAADLLPPLPERLRVVRADAEAGALFELTLRTHATSNLARQLIDAGASKNDSLRAADLIRTRIGHALGAGADLKLGLGPQQVGGDRAITSLTVITDLGQERIERRQGTLALDPPVVARSFSVTVEGGAYWSLRAGGLAPDLAAEAANLAEDRLGAGPGATINAVVGERPARFGTATAPRLLLVAVGRSSQPVRRLLSWPEAGATWIDPDRIAPPPSALARPVAGPVTSGFGARFHPILHFFRAHRGVDFGARSGDPVRAAADGCVTASGWSGGYGRQVRLVHRGALRSSYSHLSSLAVGAGQCVQRGEVIGLAGASGLATGPHLHFEVHRAGQAVDPLRHLGVADAVDGAQRQAIAARLERLGRAAS